MRQEDPEHRGLDGVEPRVVADQVEVLLVARAVEAEHPDPVGELGVVHRDETAVAESEQVLRREEAEGRGDARRDSLRAECLSRVLDDRHVERAEIVDRRRPSEEMDRHDRLRARGDPACDVGGVEVQRSRVDVGEDRGGADSRDRLGGGVEGEGRADHLVAGADLERVEHEHDRVGSVRDPDRLLDAEGLGGLAFETLDLRAEDEASALERPLERRLQLRDQRRVLRLDVNVWNRHCRSS